MCYELFYLLTNKWINEISCWFVLGVIARVNCVHFCRCVVFRTFGSQDERITNRRWSIRSTRRPSRRSNRSSWWSSGHLRRRQRTRGTCRVWCAGRRRPDWSPYRPSKTDGSLCRLPCRTWSIRREWSWPSIKWTIISSWVRRAVDRGTVPGSTEAAGGLAPGDIERRLSSKKSIRATNGQLPKDMLNMNFRFLLTELEYVLCIFIWSSPLATFRWWVAVILVCVCVCVPTELKTSSSSWSFSGQIMELYLFNLVSFLT